jgi:hypothetical protein
MQKAIATERYTVRLNKAIPIAAVVLGLAAVVSYFVLRMVYYDRFISTVRSCGGEVYFKNMHQSDVAVASAYSDRPESSLVGIPLVNQPLLVDLSKVNLSQFDWEMFCSWRPPVEYLIVGDGDLAEVHQLNLECLSELERLDVSGCNIGSQGLKEIIESLEIRELSLGNSVADEKLILELQSEKCLGRLRIGANAFSDEFIQELRTKMPWCDIQSD